MTEMSGQGSDVEQQLLQANPIVEAMGNAKTVRNNNSSRFGKYIEVHFNARYVIVGAQILNYLLEKSRIVEPGPGERNYHLFYQLCCGLSPQQKQKFKVGEALDYRCLAAGDCTTIDNTDDSREWNATLDAFKVLKFSDAEIDDIIALCSACMHLGNVQFVQQGEKAAIQDDVPCAAAAELLHVSQEELVHSLISQRKTMGRENILTFRNVASAEVGRDSLTKTLYGTLFNWTIARINTALIAKEPVDKCVGVLDIFGFEIFVTNRFEQLCINFANEKVSFQSISINQCSI